MPSRARWLLAGFLIPTLGLSGGAVGRETGGFAVSRSAAPDRGGVLDNGFRYSLSNSGGEKIRFVLRVNAGRFDANRFELAHLVEHIAILRGGRHISDIREFLELHGLRLGKDFNGRTGGYVTEYEITVPGGHPELIDVALQALRSVAGETTFNTAAVNSERLAVQNEIDLSQSPEFLVANAVKERLLQTPCLPPESISAFRESVANIPIGALEEFYETWYRPDNELLTVEGPIDVSSLEEAVRSTFSALPRPEGPLRIDRGNGVCDAHFDGIPKFVIADHRGFDGIVLQLVFMRKTGSPEKPGASTDTGLDVLVTEILSGRSTELISRYSAPYLSFSVYADGLESVGQYNADFAGLSARLRRPEAVQSALEDMAGLVKEVSKRGVDKDEVNDAVDRLNARLDQTHGKFAFDEKTVHDVNERIKEVFKYPGNLAVVIRADTLFKPSLPTEQGLAKLWAEASTAPAAKEFKRERPIQELMTAKEIARLPLQPVTLEARDAHSGVALYRLANGVQLLIRSESELSGGDEIQITGVRRGGLAGYTNQDVDSAAYAGAIAFNGGAGKYDRFKLEKFLNSRNISLGAEISEEGAFIRGSAPSSELAQLLQAMALFVTRPRWSQEAFDDWVNLSEGEGGAIAEVGSDKARDAGARHFGYIVPSRRAVVFEDAQAIFRDRFGNLGDFTFVVTGPLGKVDVLPLLNRYLGSLPSGVSEFPKTDIFRETRDYEEKIITAGAGVNAKIQISWPVIWSEESGDSVLLDVLRSALNARIFERIRVKEGASYAPQVSVGILNEGGRLDSSFVFNVVFECPADRAIEMKDAAREEIERLRKDGFDEDLLRMAKSESVRSPQSGVMPRSWNEYLVSTVGRKMYGYDPDMRNSKIADVGVKVMNDAARKYMSLDQAIDIVVLPKGYDKAAATF